VENPQESFPVHVDHFIPFLIQLLEFTSLQIKMATNTPLKSRRSF